MSETRLPPFNRHGAPVCLLTIKGRKTGEPRTVALLHLADGDDVIIVASLGGMSKHPSASGRIVTQWPHNFSKYRARVDSDSLASFEIGRADTGSL